MSVLTDLQNDPWGTLWPHRRIGLIGLGAGMVAGLVLCLILPAKWEARMLVGPAGRGASADLSALLPAAQSPTIQYVLQRVGSVTAADFSVYETLLTSPRVATALQKDGAMGEKLGDLCRACADTPAALAQWLSANVRVSPVGTTQMRRISLRLHDREFATDLLRALHRLTDETIRVDARARTDERISYLRAQLGMVANPDHRDALVGLLKEQERTRMMVGIDQDYAAEAVDPASISNKPAFPDPGIFIPVFGLLGLIAGLAQGLFKFQFGKK
jgi:uncharacterized protein involved in exopolysaccharide biosynthesis